MNPHCVVVSPSRTVNALALAVKSSHVQPGFGIFHAGFVKQRLVKGDELELGAGGHTPRAAFPLELLQRAGDEVAALERRIGIDEGLQITDQALVAHALIAPRHADDIGAGRQFLIGIIGPLAYRAGLIPESR